MLTIKGKDFEMTQVKNTNFYCLKVPVIINEGKATQRTDMQIECNAVPFETAIATIVRLRLSKLDKTVSTKEYIALFKKEVEEIEKFMVIDES